jgi:hypothetical protein
MRPRRRTVDYEIITHLRRHFLRLVIVLYTLGVDNVSTINEREKYLSSTSLSLGLPEPRAAL